ncbi:MAG: hypothetical protein MZV49_20055 [Rhodopseudomonas palustris]|nr:hypothetical protein [Rhodopseudomonas palustris]
MRWFYGAPEGLKLDVVCSRDAKSELGFTLSCSKFVAHIDDAYELSGETAYRAAEMKGIIDPAGPVAGTNVVTFDPEDDAQVVWTSGEVKVSAIPDNPHSRFCGLSRRYAGRKRRNRRRRLE